MKKTILFFLIISSSFVSRLSAQQLPLYSQYMFNPYLLNSAICGTTQEDQLKINYRDQFSGFGNGSVNMMVDGVDPSPKTYSLSYYRSVSDHSSVGLNLFQDQTLPIKTISAQLTYAYRFRFINNLYMSLALSPTYNSVSFNNTMVTDYVNDIMVDDDLGIETSGNIDFNFGLYLFNDRFDFGFAIANLAESEYKGIPSMPAGFGDDLTNNRRQHLLLHSSYDFQFGWTSSFAIVPSFLIKSTLVTKPQVDLNLKMIYMDFFWVGSSFRTSDDAIVAMCGINAQYFFLGYSYDMSTSPLASYYAGTHAVTIGVYFNSKKDYSNVRERNRFFETRSGPQYWYPGF